MLITNIYKLVSVVKVIIWMSKEDMQAYQKKKKTTKKKSPRYLFQSSKLLKLTLHFQPQQWTCEIHLWAAGAKGPVEAPVEQEGAPWSLIRQPPKINRKLKTIKNNKKKKTEYWKKKKKCMYSHQGCRNNLSKQNEINRGKNKKYS